MKFTPSSIALILMLLVFGANSFILACACCAERGTYMISSSKPDAFYLGLIDEFKYGGTADLYLTEADFEAIKGLDPIRSEAGTAAWMGGAAAFDFNATFKAKTWRFDLKSKGGKTGTLVLPIPPSMLTYKVDTHDNDDRPNGPILYKEIRFKGNLASGNGFFASGIIKPTTYFLVFQGRGNRCDNSSDFTDWRLELSGPKAQYSFFGKLTSGVLRSSPGQ